VNDGDEHTNVTTWSGQRFLAEVTRWVGDVARDAGVLLTGEREQPHVRPWSSAVRFGAEGGDLWFKVNGAGTRHEGDLVGTLARLEPSLVPPVLAVDTERGWSLTRDAGPVMRGTAPPDELWASWEAVLLRYAEAQIRLSEHREAVLATGLPEVSPVTLPTQLRSLVEELVALVPEEGGLTVAEQDKLAASFDEYDAWCDELAASGVPVSVQHDDLHSSNICWGGSGADQARVIDWGDASWGFSLATMLCTLNSLAWHAECDLDDPRVLRVRDAYLEPFTVYADRADLVRCVDLARRTGCVARALSYRAALADEPVATHRQQEFPVRAWLLELFEN
jgi:hypothetical protein